MGRKFARWCWIHKKLTVATLFVLAVVAVNAVAYMHAYSMTHFTRAGDRTQNPEELSLLRKLGVLITGVNIPRPTNGVAPDTVGLTYETHKFTTADGFGIEVWHIEHPKPKGVVLMFHGYSAVKCVLLGEARALNDLGYDVILTDFRGSGGSDGDQTTIGVFEAHDVLAVYEYARQRWPSRPIILFGQSMGSAAILRAVAVSGIRPDALILECPFDRLLSTVANRFHSMRLPSFPLAHILVFWGGVQNDFNGFEHNPVEYAAHVTCPTLLLHGNDDERVTRKEADAVFAQFKGRKRFHAFDGVGHYPYFRAVPEQWKQEVGRFLAAEF